MSDKSRTALRMECLKIAVQYAIASKNTINVLTTAKLWFEFVDKGNENESVPDFRVSSDGEHVNSTPYGNGKYTLRDLRRR